MPDPKEDHFYNAVPISIVDPANPEIGCLLFRMPDGQYYYSMSRQAFEQLARDMLVQLEQAPLSARK
jgi:hypothetical protein